VTTFPGYSVRRGRDPVGTIETPMPWQGKRDEAGNPDSGGR
jgi:hypothetical protein